MWDLFGIVWYMAGCCTNTKIIKKLMEKNRLLEDKVKCLGMEIAVLTKLNQELNARSPRSLWDTHLDAPDCFSYEDDRDEYNDYM